jgi:hypothetical protein
VQALTSTLTVTVVPSSISLVTLAHSTSQSVFAFCGFASFPAADAAGRAPRRNLRPYSGSQSVPVLATAGDTPRVTPLTCASPYSLGTHTHTRTPSL